MVVAMNAIDEQSEALFRRGFPHLREVLDGHPDDAGAADRAAKAFFGRRDYTTAWPRDVATRFLRAMASGSADACQTAGPLTGAEAQAVLSALTRPENTSREHLVETALFLLEALRGTGWTLDAVLSRLEGMPKSALEARNLHGPIFVAWWSGFLLKRVAPAVATKARARMQALVDRGLNSVTQQLAFVLGGERALEASGHKITPFNCLYCTDAAFIAKHARYPGFVVLDPYLAWLGGDPVLEVYVDLAKKLDREWAPQAIEGMARLASPLAVKVLEVLAGKKYLAAQVAEALASRGGGPKRAATARAAPKKKPAPQKKQAQGG